MGNRLAEGAMVEYKGRYFVVVQEQSAGIIVLPSGYQDCTKTIVIHDKKSVRMLNQ